MNRRETLRGLLVVVFLILVAGVGILLAFVLVPPPQIAVIRVEGDIWGPYTAYVGDALEAAGRDPQVRAIVIDIASPGGEVTASEDLYYQVLGLREVKPVVASIGEIAASGAYYLAAATDQIYANPGSTVGNIGVISVLPTPDVVDESLITSGPFKLSGGSQLASIRQIEMLKETFLAAIMAQRGDRLRVELQTLSRGEVYLGLQALQMGLVDQIGSGEDAVAGAARMAGLRHYRVVDRSPAFAEEALLLGMRLQRGSTAAALASPPEHLAPGFYYRYVDPLP